MKKRVWSPLYSFFYPLVYLATRLFYRRWKVIGRKKFPARGTPVIVVSNHQNALLDPLLCCLTVPQQMHFLTRADVFRNAFFRPIIFALNMMPVYRSHDRESGKNQRNQETFEVAIARLKKGAVVGIFPEGNHGAKKILRPMKRGLAHLLELAAETGLRNISIVPIAVDYSEYDHARSSLIVNFGEAFQVDDLLFTDAERKERHTATMDRVKQKLSATMIDIGPTIWYETLRLAEASALHRLGYKRWLDVKSLLQALRKKILDAPEDFSTCTEVNAIARALEDSALTHRSLLIAAQSLSKRTFLALLVLPFALPAILLFSLPWQLVLLMTRKTVVDPCFNSTFRLVFALLVFLPVWLGASFLLGGLFPIVSGWVYLIGFGISGGIALPVMDQIRDLREKKSAQLWIEQNPELHAKWIEIRDFLDEQMLTKK